MAVKIFKGKQPVSGNLSVWATEFRLKDLSAQRRAKFFKLLLLLKHAVEEVV